MTLVARLAACMCALLCGVTAVSAQSHQIRADRHRVHRAHQSSAQAALQHAPGA